MNHDHNTDEQSELNYTPYSFETNFRHPHLLHLDPISPSGLCKLSPPTLIRVKEESLSKRRVCRLGDKQFRVIVYPAPGQSIHTITLACQRRKQHNISRRNRKRQLLRSIK